VSEWGKIMKFRSGILAVALASSAALASANAADLYHGPDAGGFKDGPVYVGVNWSGAYAGVNGGMGWSDRTDFLDPTGAFGGGQIGYNFQRGPLVVGLEADIGGAGVTDSAASNTSSLDWFGSVRGRVGYALDRALVYATGGYGYGRVRNNAGSQTQDGWVVGNGVEYKITPAWTARLEAQFYDLSASSSIGPLGMGAGSHTEFSALRVGLNYFFGNGYEPMK
jgi:outer membrane immunogenic protein